MILIGQGVVDWVAKQTNEFGSFGGGHGIGWGEAQYGIIKTIRAGVVYADWNGPNVVCHIASDRSRRWLAREYLWTIFDYPFRQLKVQRITVTVGEGNTDSRRFVEHLGFTEEASLERAHPTGDLVVYRMFKENCRWIHHENLYKVRLPLAA